MSYLGIQRDRRNLAVPHFQHASRRQSVQDGPLKIGIFSLCATWRRSEYLPPIYVTCLRLETQRPETTKDSIGTRQTVSHQAARAYLGDSRVSLSKVVGGSLTFWKRVTETSRGGGGGTAMNGLANGEDTRVWLASAADADDEGAYATVFSLDNQAGHEA